MTVAENGASVQFPLLTDNDLYWLTSTETPLGSISDRLRKGNLMKPTSAVFSIQHYARSLSQGRARGQDLHTPPSQRKARGQYCYKASGAASENGASAHSSFPRQGPRSVFQQNLRTPPSQRRPRRRCYRASGAASVHSTFPRAGKFDIVSFTTP